MTRQYRIVALSIWPGLAQVWSGQEILGLLLGLFFASALNLAVVGRWIWFEAFPPGWSDFFAYLAAITWLASFTYTLWWVGFCHPDRHRREIDQLYREAQEAYLQGRWIDARRRIERILTMDESDADALMQLGTIYLRTQQPVLARRSFRQCLESHGGANGAGKSSNLWLGSWKDERHRQAGAGGPLREIPSQGPARIRKRSLASIRFVPLEWRPPRYHSGCVSWMIVCCGTFETDFQQRRRLPPSRSQLR